MFSDIVESSPRCSSHSLYIGVRSSEIKSGLISGVNRFAPRDESMVMILIICVEFSRKSVDVRSAERTADISIMRSIWRRKNAIGGGALRVGEEDMFALKSERHGIWHVKILAISHTARHRPIYTPTAPPFGEAFSNQPWPTLCATVAIVGGSCAHNEDAVYQSGNSKAADAEHPIKDVHIVAS